MKRILMVMTIASALTAAVLPQEQKAPPKKAPATKAATKAAPKPMGETEIPAGAKEIDAGTYRWIDPKGVAWIYRKTPFGLMKHQETKDDLKPEPEAVPTDWIVADKGDSLMFTRPSPFGGSQTWTRKKDELTSVEKAVWDRSKTAAK